MSLLSFKAGRMEFDEESKLVTPKKGQGLIKVTRNADDPMLLSFVWEPRGKYKQTAGPDDRDELLLFPGDAQWKYVKQCKTGRAFSLRFRSSGQRLFFWLQTPNDSDEGDLSALSAQDNIIADQLAKLLDEESLTADGSEPQDVEITDAAD